MSYSIKVLTSDKTAKKVSGFNSLKDFDAKPKLIAEVVRSEMLNQRSGNAHTKNRGEVRGGGKKPWKQKGTGRARHGSIRSPLWVGGGVTFGPRSNRNWHSKINRSARNAALKSILKDRLEEALVFQFEDGFDYPKTKDAISLIEAQFSKNATKGKTVIVYTTDEKLKINGFANLDVILVNAANVKIMNLVTGTQLILTPAAKDLLETRIEKA